MSSSCSGSRTASHGAIERLLIPPDLLGGFYAHRTMSSSPWQRRHGASNHRGARPRAGRRGGGPRRRETGAAQRHQLHDQRRDGI
jgi:hypothetical protein